MMRTALWIVQQVEAEMGLPRAVSLFTTPTQLDTQLTALLNSAGAELRGFFPWEQLNVEWVWTTQASIGAYALPADWDYFIDQSQWDRTNHWPLLGPKTTQEWQWIKGGLISQGPRLRYRIQGGQFMLWPVPGSVGSGTYVPWTLAMEYISKNWVQSIGGSNADLIQSDNDVPMFDEWLLTKFLKLKFWETKGFDTSAFRDDFLNKFFGLTGQNMGAPTLTMSPRPASIYIGPNNIPDGSWPVGSTI
jgi:hypothetical protein